METLPAPGWADGVMPLSEFPEWMQDEIADVVAEPKPPDKWLVLDGGQIESRAWYEWHWARDRQLWRIGRGPRDRPAIPERLRQEVYARDGYRCLHCGTTERLSLDHIHPYSLGGPDAYDNLQTLCRSCNSRKGTRV